MPITCKQNHKDRDHLREGLAMWPWMNKFEHPRPAKHLTNRVDPVVGPLAMFASPH